MIGFRYHLVSLAAVVAITVAATGNNPPKPATVPSLASLAIKIALGVVLVRIAVRHIRAKNRPKPPKKPPKWQEHVDAMSPWFALGLAPASARPRPSSPAPSSA